MSLPENREVTAAHTKGKERSEGHRKKYCRKSNVGNGRIGAGKRGITDASQSRLKKSLLWKRKKLLAGGHVRRLRTELP